MLQKLTMTKSLFEDILRIREELDSVVETIEMMNNKDLREGIERSRKNVNEGRVRKLKSVDDIDAW
ncbi:MAG: hypothetical protein KGZ49_05965 [Syntrophaceae bacterium]|nr:hypothetical protein [Syntrophaceae bacterium]